MARVCGCLFPSISFLASPVMFLKGDLSSAGQLYFVHGTCLANGGLPPSQFRLVGCLLLFVIRIQPQNDYPPGTSKLRPLARLSSVSSGIWFCGPVSFMAIWLDLLGLQVVG